MGRLRPPMQLHITSTKVHILSPVTLLQISETRNESKWPDRVVSLGPLALKSDTEHDVYAKFQCSLNALFCEPTEICEYKRKLYMYRVPEFCTMLTFLPIITLRDVCHNRL